MKLNLIQQFYSQFLIDSHPQNMSIPIIEKIIGSSRITRNNLSVHYSTGACAIACDGFLSIVLPKDEKRYDLEVSNDCREITAISFSNNGQHLVIGETGPNARFFVVTFSDQFDRILTKNETKTKENGFSCLAMNSESGRLITVGNDSQPFFVLWDLTQPRTTCIGCYHLPTIPTHLNISNDSNFAIVTGKGMLKFIDTSIPSNNNPVILKSKNGNIGQFKDTNFVSCAISVESPHSAYGLTDTGILCYFDSSSIPFKSHGQNLISTVPICLNCGETTSLSLDKKIILVGTATGSVLVIRKKNNTHETFGQFSSDGKSVVAIGIGERLTAAAYSDGHLMFWQRRINSQPILTIPSHRGPVCGIAVLPHCIVSCGSDSTIRSWKLQMNQALIGISSQEQICMKTITKLADNYTTDITGVRCVAAKDDVIFAGDNSGNLHILKLEGLDETKKIVESFQGVMCVAVHPNQSLVATGGGDGKARIYKISGDNVILSASKQCHANPITSIVFTPNGFVTTSFNGIKFCNLPQADIYSSTDTNDALLSLATIPNGKVVIAGGCDGFITLWLVKDGSLFRRYKSSPSSYPLSIATDKAGLFIAAALSDGTVKILDLFSGDIIYSFNSHAGMMTSISFHENDLLLSSFSGCIFRWTLPQTIHNAVSERMGKADQPIFNILRTNEILEIPRMEIQNDQSIANQGTLMKGSIPAKNWIFESVKNNPIQLENPLTQETNAAQEDDDEVEQAGFDAPRPNIEGEYEARVDDLVRQSFIRLNKEASLNHVQQSESNSVISPEESTEDMKNLKPNKDQSLIRKKQLHTDDSQESLPIKKRPDLLHSKQLITKNDHNEHSVDITPDKDTSQKVLMSKADEMTRAALDLKNSYEAAKALLAQQPTCPEEIAAQTMIQNAIDMIKRDLCDSQLTSQIREYAQLILSAVDKL